MLIKRFFDAVDNATSLEEAKTYAKSVRIIMEESEQVAVTIMSYDNGHIIPLIKILRDRFKLGLKEAKDIADHLPRTFSMNSVEAKRLTSDLFNAGNIYYKTEGGLDDASKT